MDSKDREWQPAQVAGNAPLDRGSLFLSDLGALSCGGPPLGSVSSNAPTNGNLSAAFLGALSELPPGSVTGAVHDASLGGNTNDKEICEYNTLRVEKDWAICHCKIACLRKAKKNGVVQEATNKPGAKRQRKNDKPSFQKAKSVKHPDIYDGETQQGLNLYKKQCNKVFT